MLLVRFTLHTFADVMRFILRHKRHAYPARRTPSAGLLENLIMRLLIGGLSALLLSACTHAADCSFQPLPLKANAEKPSIFIGQGQRISVSFTNENPDISEPDAFPEPPVVISDSVSGTTCSIEDGGIWARDPLYLSADERRLLTYEFSGSNAELVAYDTSTCKELHRMDISGQKVAIESGGLTLGSQCHAETLDSCASSTHTSLVPFCQP